MIDEMLIYDADAHVVVSQRSWESMPEAVRHRRPRPVEIGDADELGGYRTAWYCEGRVIPHAWGPGSQPGNTPKGSLDLETFPGVGQITDSRVGVLSFGGQDMSDPDARLTIMDDMGIDSSVLFPSTFYAAWTQDPAVEAGLYRSYNRYVGKACQANAKRLKFGGLLPLRDVNEAHAAIDEMQDLGATSAISFSTAGERLLSDPAFVPVFKHLEDSGLPLSIHFGASYPPLWQLTDTMYTGNIIGMTMPIVMAFFAVTSGGVLDRHPNLKVGFFEFGSEWILYMVPRMHNYMSQARSHGLPYASGLPEQDVLDYCRSGRLFFGCEAEDDVLVQEIELVGEDHICYSSDIPHPEMRENGAEHIAAREDLTREQKEKILGLNAVNFFGAP